ncbi:hypothetical protein FBQ81_00730 [Chloroflexi bacterium CFX6]|nr:hypothetical protein [Chloroflexi bacterium CFX6]
MTERETKWKERVPEETREHYKKARQEMREAIRKFLPEGFVEHQRKARREMLLAWRSMLDHALKKMDEKA